METPRLALAMFNIESTEDLLSKSSSMAHFNLMGQVEDARLIPCWRNSLQRDMKDSDEYKGTTTSPRAV